MLLVFIGGAGLWGLVAGSVGFVYSGMLKTRPVAFWKKSRACFLGSRQQAVGSRKKGVNLCESVLICGKKALNYE